MLFVKTFSLNDNELEHNIEIFSYFFGKFHKYPYFCVRMKLNHKILFSLVCKLFLVKVWRDGGAFPRFPFFYGTSLIVVGLK
ncbi:MAG TPA: hypothetical protein DCX03_10620 [Bacteroidales bacterium]|nr:hypothetical protein [Bacteroidales bacterium]